MNDTATSRNRHPVDRLADVRAEIKKLTEEEGELKARVIGMMGSADSLGGDQYIASQSLQERKGSLDDKKLEKALGVDDLDAYRKPKTTSIVVKVEPRLSSEAA